jgi:hypothetical protein
MNAVQSPVALYTVIFITDTTHIYAIKASDGTVADLGYPSHASVASQYSARIQVENGKIFATYASSGSVYYATITSLPLAGAWSTVTLTGGTNVGKDFGVHFMENFRGYIYYADAPFDGSSNPLAFLDRLDYASFTLAQYPAPQTLSLGGGSNILGLLNYNNKYLAIVSSIAINNDYTNCLLRLWDGVSLSTNYSIKIPGKYLDMIVIEGTLYMAVAVSPTKTKLYMLYNTTLREVFTQQYSMITSSLAGGNAPINCLFNFNNSVGMRLSTVTADSLIYPLMIYGKQDIGQSEFILSHGLFFGTTPEMFCIGNDGLLYSFSNRLSGSGTTNVISYYPSTGTIHFPILYKSQWIPVKNLQALDIYYESPPASGTDAINVTIDGQGEDYKDSVPQPFTTALASITPTTYLTKKRTRLDVKGFTGNQLRITLSTVNTGTWRPKINKIVPIEK